MPRSTSARVSGGLPGDTTPIVDPGGAERGIKGATPAPYPPASDERICHIQWRTRGTRASRRRFGFVTFDGGGKMIPTLGAARAPSARGSAVELFLPMALVLVATIERFDFPRQPHAPGTSATSVPSSRTTRAPPPKDDRPLVLISVSTTTHQPREQVPKVTLTPRPVPAPTLDSGLR
jgi:hypothetical protein